MDIAKLPRIALAACCLFLFSGCGSVFPLAISQTRQFYTASAGAQYTPKPKDYPMPVLTKVPKRKFKVIGSFEMQSKLQDFDFIQKAAQYNARLAGADAVLVLQRWHSPYTAVDYPNETSDTEEVQDRYTAGDAAAGKPVTYHEETTIDMGDPETYTEWSSDFVAQMIVFK